MSGFAKGIFLASMVYGCCNWNGNVLGADLPLNNTQSEGCECCPEHGKLFTSDASPVDPGRYEFELKYALLYSSREWDTHHAVHETSSLNQHSGLAQFTIGALPNLDFSINAGVTQFNQGKLDSTNVSDVNVGARWRFFEKKEWKFEIAYLAAVTVPATQLGSSNAPGSQQYYSASQGIVMSKDWGRWTMNAEVGVGIPFGCERRDARTNWLANVAVGYQCLSWLQLEVEVNTTYNVNARSNNDGEKIAVTTGLVLPLNSQIRVNIGVQQDVWGRNNAQTTTGIFGLKVSW